jgi:hypothetical protein
LGLPHPPVGGFQFEFGAGQIPLLQYVGCVGWVSCWVCFLRSCFEVLDFSLGSLRGGGWEAAAFLEGFQWVDAWENVWCLGLVVPGDAELGGLVLGSVGRGRCEVSWVAVVCRCSGSGAAGDMPSAAWLHNFLGGRVFLSTSGWVGGRGAGAVACPCATVILGHGAGGGEVLAFVRRCCRVGRGLCSDPGAAKGPIVQMLLEGHGVGGRWATMVGGRRGVRRSGHLRHFAVVQARAARLRNVGHCCSHFCPVLADWGLACCRGGPFEIGRVRSGVGIALVTFGRGLVETGRH